MADITYLQLAEEFGYLAVILDAFSRQVVGWALEAHLQAQLATSGADDDHHGTATNTRRDVQGVSTRKVKQITEEGVGCVFHAMVITDSRPS